MRFDGRFYLGDDKTYTTTIPVPLMSRNCSKNEISRMMNFQFVVSVVSSYFAEYSKLILLFKTGLDP
jgi:hypothetical protein